uniref:Disease resistance R13L4/SHOC-2-like LRR domain-containing protein n=1 Tax=Oryza meridionalis TaxID=40149 RepID=A0A0E0DNA7_9ORYZ
MKANAAGYTPRHFAVLPMASASAGGGGGETPLVDRCIDAAAGGAATVEAWRRQRRSLERLPAQLADALLRRLAARRLLFPSLLEVFQHSVEEIDLSGHIAVDAEWLAYLGAFRYLRVLKLADCKNVNSSAVWALSGMSTLKELDLSRCSKISDAGIKHIASIESLEKLHVSQTGLTDNGVMAISSLINLRLLDLGGVRFTDKALRSLQVLTQLEHLDIWGSEITNEGASVLIAFTSLSFLNISWTRFMMENSVKVLSLSALEELKYLESLNLNNTQLMDDVIPPLASFRALKYLFLKSDFLSDPALHALSSASNLIHLGFCGNILSTTGLRKFVPPATLRMLDLSGCWILTGDAISAFCTCHPVIEVRHELIQELQANYGDERIKYSKEEMMELQHQAKSNSSMHVAQLPPELRRSV